jgi:hypothetical protein
LNGPFMKIKEISKIQNKNLTSFVELRQISFNNISLFHL